MALDKNLGLLGSMNEPSQVLVQLDILDGAVHTLVVVADCFDAEDIIPHWYRPCGCLHFILEGGLVE